MITVKASVSSAEVTGAAVVQVSAPEPSVRAAGVFVRRATPNKQVCCQPRPQRNQKNDILNMYKDVDGGITRLTDPLDTRGLQELPGLVACLKWLKKSKSVGVRNFLAKYLAENTDVFMQEISKFSHPEDYGSTIEAVCGRVWRLFLAICCLSFVFISLMSADNQSLLRLNL